MHMQSVEDFLQVDDDLIHSIHGGALRNPGDPPVVLVHGISGSTNWWVNNFDALSELTEVYALDLPGFGRSRTNKSFDIESEVTALAKWLSAVKLRRAIFVGHSLGGYITAVLSARSPELAAGLVLVDPAIFPPGYSAWRLAFGLMRSPFHLSLDFVPTLLKGAADVGPATMLRAARDLLARPILHELSAIRARTMLVWGNHDIIVPLSLSDGVISALPERPIGPVLLRGGHVSMWDDPDGFNEAMRKFLSEL
jgi:pimeloyl-ACP methyl ester carboxylesterase